MKAPRLLGCAVPSLILFLKSSLSQVHFAVWCLSDFCVESGALQRGISAGKQGSHRSLRGKKTRVYPEPSRVKRGDFEVQK